MTAGSFFPTVVNLPRQAEQEDHQIGLKAKYRARPLLSCIDLDGVGLGDGPCRSNTVRRRRRCCVYGYVR